MIAPMETRRDRETNIDLSHHDGWGRSVESILTPVYHDGSPDYPVAINSMTVARV